MRNESSRTGHPAASCPRGNRANRANRANETVDAGFQVFPGYVRAPYRICATVDTLMS
jgi:hypothetical protein